MILEDIMKKSVIAVSPLEPIKSALSLMNQHHIRHIPIIDSNQKIVGIISDRDIRDVSPSIFHQDEHLEDLEKPVQTIMTKDVITGHPMDFVEEAAVIFFDHKIGCLPIEKDNKLVGIVTETDILYTLVQLTGAHQPSSHLEIRVANQTGVLADVAVILKKFNINIASVLIYPEQDVRYKILVFRVQTMDTTRIVSELKKNGYTVLWPSDQEFLHE
ncbi:acetoin utilization AcuB family protein [Litchfieldia salsa]|uniref:Acetoin utilization protein AcuB n=1 Tax=Litchfieldia salsa TaxID=930152 RepID=A0A1H0P6V0_9BACI|nr:acetoin utilization AcuB family protein [Litchfieldia salsa]SDP00430.1 acetoin utilization protein AcuB [Litchfieldia salsa]